MLHRNCPKGCHSISVSYQSYLDQGSLQIGEGSCCCQQQLPTPVLQDHPPPFRPPWPQEFCSHGSPPALREPQEPSHLALQPALTALATPSVGQLLFLWSWQPPKCSSPLVNSEHCSGIPRWFCQFQHFIWWHLSATMCKASYSLLSQASAFTYTFTAVKIASILHQKDIPMNLSLSQKAFRIKGIKTVLQNDAHSCNV